MKVLNRVINSPASFEIARGGPQDIAAAVGPVIPVPCASLEGVIQFGHSLSKHSTEAVPHCGVRWVVGQVVHLPGIGAVVEEQFLAVYPVDGVRVALVPQRTPLMPVFPDGSRAANLH